MARADRQQHAHDQRRRPSAAKSSIATATCSPTASTPTRSPPIPPKSTTPTTWRGRFAARSTAARARPSAGHGARTCAANAPFVYLARQVSPEEAQRVRGAGVARHHASQREPPLLSEAASSRRTCSATSVSTTSAWPGIESAYDAQIRGARRQGSHPDRRAAARAHQPRRTSRHRRRGHRADDRSVPAVRRRA